MENRHADSLRKETLRTTALQAKKDFSDTRYNWLRTGRNRRALVVLTFLVLVAYAVSTLFDLPWVGLLSLLTYMACMFGLRVSVRGITEYPDELVDERMREERGYSYRYAYVGTMSLLSLYLLIYIGNQLLAKPGWVGLMTADTLHDLFFPVFFACLVLPSAIYAWTHEDWAESDSGE